jgi:predicted aconitase with swiveling domain
MIAFEGTTYFGGADSSRLLANDVELSFWAGVMLIQEIMDWHHHPLSVLQDIQDTIVAIPGGRGSFFFFFFFFFFLGVLLC